MNLRIDMTKALSYARHAATDYADLAETKSLVDKAFIGTRWAALHSDYLFFVRRIDLRDGVFSVELKPCDDRHALADKSMPLAELIEKFTFMPRDRNDKTIYACEGCGSNLTPAEGNVDSLCESCKQDAIDGKQLSNEYDEDFNADLYDIDTLSDFLNAEIGKAETALEEKSPNFEVSVPLLVGSFVSLRCNAKGYLSVLGTGPELDLTAAPRKVRLAAVKLLPRIHEARVAQAGASLQEVKEALTSVKAFTAKLRGSDA